jgi:hypothetical protein
MNTALADALGDAAAAAAGAVLVVGDAGALVAVGEAVAVAALALPDAAARVETGCGDCCVVAVGAAQAATSARATAEIKAFTTL